MMSLLSNLFVLWAWIKITTIPILKLLFAILVVNTPNIWKFYHKPITNRSHLEILIDMDLPYSRFKKMCHMTVINSPNYRIDLESDVITNMETYEESPIKFDSIKTTIELMD